MRKVHWNKLARSDYYQNIDYLLREWTEKDAQEFIDEVDETEFILKQGKVIAVNPQPTQCPRFCNIFFVMLFVVLSVHRSNKKTRQKI